ncbi:MAG TPA: glycogen-binding domain-containing protein [Elusimicrobiales bacterium]|nr:glycogen-binding domain-containing protein [Elusimicrobiales bacterium]
MQEQQSAHPQKRSPVAAIKTWRALVIFSALALLAFAAMLYKAIESRFRPLPGAQRHEASAAGPRISPFQSIASSATVQDSFQKPEPPTAAPIAVAAVAATTEPVAAILPQEKPAEEKPQQPTVSSSTTTAQSVQVTIPAQKSKTRKVRFTYTGREAGPILLTGTFLSWKTVEMKKARGKWTAELYMAPGVYRYCFIINGVKKPDPLQPLRQGGHSLAVVR